MGINEKQQIWLSWIVRRLLEFAPLIALAALAGLTYWLLQQKVALPVRAAAPVEHKPDYTLIDFVVRTFDAQGRSRTQIAGKRLDFYPDNETYTIDNPIVKSRGLEVPAVSQTVAARATSNRDGSEVQFFGAVKATRDAYIAPAKGTTAATAVPPLEVASEFLHVWTNEEKLRSHLPTVITRGKSRMSAQQVELSNYDGNVGLKGRAHITLEAKIPQ